MEIDTKLGTLTVSESGYSIEGYPGFVVALKRNGIRHEFLMVEVDETEDEPVLKTHIWDGVQEDPVFDFVAEAEEIDKMRY